jgi:hypothetical protein
MKHISATQLLIVTVLLSLSTNLWAATARVPSGALDYSRANPALVVSRDTPAHTRVRLTSPEVLVADTTADFQTYQIFGIQGEPFIYRNGSPTLPQVTRLYRIPNTGSASLEILNADFDTMEGINPLPYQSEPAGFNRTPARDDAVYGNDAWYPPQVAVMSTPMIFRDFRVVQVTLYPVQVNPVTHQARVYRNLGVDVVANDLPGENEILNPGPPSRTYAPLYRNQIANLDDHALDDVTYTPGSYLILCWDDSISRKWSDSLATWKKRLGFSVTVNARGDWTFQNMRAAVVQAYNTSNPRLEFVCIYGDAGSGTHPMPTHPSEYDHYYADIAGTDQIEDIGIGRLPTASGDQFKLVYRKILAYEQNPYMDDPGWFRRVFLYAGTANGITSNEELMLWARQQFFHFTGVTTVNVATHAGNVSNALIAQRLNEGVSYFLWRGTVVGEMEVSAASGTNNGTKLPVVLTITCGSGDIGSSTCLSKSWILAGTPTSLKGGVCGIGTATYGTHVQYNNTVAGGLVYNICNLGVENLGNALGGAKSQLTASFIGDEYAVNFIHWNNLLGDPGLALWTDQPLQTNVDYPGTVNVGTRRIRPQVTDQLTDAPIPGALVVLWKEPDCYATAVTDINGFADVPVTVNSPGILTLTVSKRNMKPFLADIQCVPAGMMVTASRMILDDDNVDGTSGNGNGEMNPGETIDLRTYLRNFGTTDIAQNVTATITSDNPKVTILNATSSFAQIAPGDSALSVTPFRIHVAPTMWRGESVIITVAVTASDLTSHSSLRLTCKAGEASFSSLIATDQGGNNDGYLDPGEHGTLQVSLYNTGDLALNNTTAVLHSFSSYITVTGDTSPFGTIAAGAIVNNSANPFTLSVNPMAYRGHPAHLLLVLTTVEGSVDSVYFTLTLGQIQSTDPTGPDAYGYYAYDNSDVTYEMYRPFHYDNISTTGANLNLNDPGEAGQGDPTFSSVRQLPFPFVYYGQTYTEITVSSNGWAAFGNHAEVDQFRNYPIPGQQAPDAMLAPFWDDLCTRDNGRGVWEKSEPDSHRYVIQWKARGAIVSGPTTADFEIILLDPAHYPTRDGNGIIVFQYNQIQENAGQSNDVPYSTIGIQAPGCTVGLMYRFNNTATPGSGGLIAGRSVVFTTESRVAFGTVTGIVTDAATNQPMPNVDVFIQGQSFRDTTDANGRYWLSNVLIGTYTIRAIKPGYNENQQVNIVVQQNDTTTLNLPMLHPEIQLSAQQISVTLPDDPATTSFEIINQGNGPLDYQIAVSYSATSGLDDNWTYRNGINVSSLTQDPQIQGCELIGDYWWVTGGMGNGGHKYFYRFDLNGAYVDAIPQPSDSAFGWFDMAYDGQYLYGSNGPVIQGVDQTGTVRTQIPSPVNPTRAIAYDPGLDHFWVADLESGLYEIDRDGAIQQHISVNSSITGLAWYANEANGYKLFIFGRERQTQQHAIASKLHTVSGDLQPAMTLDRSPGDGAGGCTITSGWNNSLIVFAGILQNGGNDRLGIWEMEFNTSWISVSPLIGTVIGGSTRDVEIRFDPAGLRAATYHVHLTITNNSGTGTIVLPVTLVDNISSASDRPELTTDYQLYQNYPNPFNGRTTFRYDLKQAGNVSLRLYNLIGQEVATVVNEQQEAGPHTLSMNFDQLSTGVYIYRLESGSFTDTRKLILLR